VHRNFIYGLVAPCYEQAAVLAHNLVAKDAEVNPKKFLTGDLSTKLKLMGVDVAGFGQYATNEGGVEDSDDVTSVVYQDPFKGIYRKLTLSKDGTQRGYVGGGDRVGERKGCRGVYWRLGVGGLLGRCLLLNMER
jgi:nitrite reductase (NADH) large subunit